MLKIIKSPLLAFKFLVLTIVITVKPPLLFLAALKMPIAKVSLLSHGQRLIILNFNTHLLNMNTRIKLKKIDALMESRKLSLKVRLEQSLLNQSALLETKSPPHISIENFKSLQARLGSHSSLMKLKPEWVHQAKTGLMNTGT